MPTPSAQHAPRVRRASAARTTWIAFLLLLAACKQRDPASFSFFDERIEPILDVGCQRQTTGCHVDDGRGSALGNLDVSSYDSLMRRHDVLAPVGPYSIGLLLLKAGNPSQVDVRTIDPPDPSQPDKRRVTVTTDIRHAAGEGAIAQGSRDYSALKQWIDGGYSRSGVIELHLNQSSGACSHTLLSRPYIDTTSAPTDGAGYQQFKRDVAPILQKRCAGGLCHGAVTSDLYLTCGVSEDELRWNYELARRYLDDVAATSELLRRPLAKPAGGVFHEGGDIFADVNDPDYRKLLAWAGTAVTNDPSLLIFPDADPGLRFFANRVEPTLVRKGCMFLNCHSPAMFNDLRLRLGARGFFSEVAIRKNYEIVRAFLAADSEDPNQSRIIAKNLCPPSSGGHGIQHRGGALFEDFGGCGASDTGASVDKCAGLDADGGDLNTIPAYCVLARWHAIERAQLITKGELPASAAPTGVVFVTRPEGIGGGADFDTFAPGADLRWADAQQDATGALQLGATHSLLAGCGLSGSIDVRNPALAWDGQHLAFAARSDATRPLRIYQMRPDGSECAPLAGLAADSEQQDGIAIHDFDPAYAPDGRLVFASCRGNSSGDAPGGPTRTPAALTPNANLYVFAAGDSAPVRQLTFLSNQEFGPSFMMDGRVIFTAEKRAQDFHQFAARRQNLDGGDYHPLIAQRPSVGFASATDLIELVDRNFALVAADLHAADGGGRIAIVNRSIGPDQTDRDPSDRAYIHSVTSLTSSGVFRSPAALPSGRLIAACDLSTDDPSQGPHHYALCELDLGSAPRVLWQDPSSIALEPVPVWVREPRSVFQSRLDEPNGSTQIAAGQTDAIVQINDLPVLGTLLFQNTRIGRPISSAVHGVEVWQARPPPSAAHDFAALTSNVVSDSFGKFYQDLHSLGHASIAADGAVRMRLPAGVPLSLGLLDRDDKTLTFGTDAPFSGPMRQREELQFYPGERNKQSFPRRLFNGLCAGCHGSISGRELDAVVDVDVLSGASLSLAPADPVDLR
jgi:hypothetical protein